MTLPTHRRLLWILRALGPCSDNVLERVMRGVPGGTVRGARLKLVRMGLVVASGLTKDGRKKWRVR